MCAFDMNNKKATYFTNLLTYLQLITKLSNRNPSLCRSFSKLNCLLIVVNVASLSASRR